MSIKLVSWVLDNYTNDDCSQWKAMVALAEWSGPDGVCFPSIASISNRLGRSKRQTQRVLEALASSLDIIIAPPEKIGRGHYNAYLVVGNKSHQEVGEILRTNKVLAGRFTDAEIEAVINAVSGAQPAATRSPIDEDDYPDEPGGNLAHVPVRTPPAEEKPSPGGTGKQQGKRPSLFEGEFTAEKELQMLLGGVIEHPPRWDPGEVKKLQAELERVLDRQGKHLSDDHKRLAVFFRYATGWDYPIKSRWGQWTHAFQEHAEIFGDQFLIADLYEASVLSLLNSQNEARDKGKSFNVPPHPTSLTKTMEAIYAEKKAREKANKPLFTEGDIMAKMTNPRKVV